MFPERSNRAAVSAERARSAPVTLPPRVYDVRPTRCSQRTRTLVLKNATGLNVEGEPETLWAEDEPNAEFVVLVVWECACTNFNRYKKKLFLLYVVERSVRVLSLRRTQSYPPFFLFMIDITLVLEMKTRVGIRRSGHPNNSVELERASG